MEFSPLPVKHGFAKTLKSAVCLFILPYPVYAISTLWPYFSIYYSCVYNAKMNLWLIAHQIFDYISSVCGIFDIPIFLYLKHITPCSFLTLLFGFLHVTDSRITCQLQPFSFRK